ncbi:hypothetical protein FA13DRAFT_1739128, partial [Coprinellus micaceus]
VEWNRRRISPLTSLPRHARTGRLHASSMIPSTISRVPFPIAHIVKKHGRYLPSARKLKPAASLQQTSYLPPENTFEGQLTGTLTEGGTGAVIGAQEAPIEITIKSQSTRCDH